MNFFIAERTNKNNDEMICQMTKCYAQVEIPKNDELSFFVYIIPKTDDAYYVAISLDDYLESFFENYDEDLYDVYAATWPTLITLLSNGVKEKYSEGAIITLVDEDCGENKQFIVTVVGNVDFDTPDDIDSEKFVNAIALVIPKAVSLFREITENKPSTWKTFFAGAKQGVFEGIKIWLNSLNSF